MNQLVTSEQRPSSVREASSSRTATLRPSSVSEASASRTATLDGEIIPPGDMVRVVGLTQAFHGRVETHVPAGLSIAEILHQVAPGSRQLLVHLVNESSQAPVLEADWHRVRVKPGTTLIFRPHMQGDDVLRSALGIVLAVAALVIAPWAAGFITIAGMALVGTGLTVVTSLIAGGLILAGTLALNALFPTRPPQLSDSGASEAFANAASIQGARNQAAPFLVVPQVLGRHRMSPFYAAQPYTELVGDDQWLRLLFCFGYGPLTLEDFRIGETPLNSFAGFEAQVRLGYPSDPPVTIFPSQVHEDQLSITLINDQSWQTRVTADGIDEISIDVTAPEGVYQLNSETGLPGDWSVSIGAQYQPVAGGSWASIGTGLIQFDRSTKTVRRGLRQPVARGQYNVRVARVSPDQSDGRIKDKVVWTALRGLVNDNPIKFPHPLALVGLRIRATDQLNGVVDTFNAVAASVVLAFNGTNWVGGVVSNSPADLFRHVLQGAANARPVPDSEVDVLNLQEWWAYCQANGFTFNQVRTQSASVYDALADIAAAGRAVPTFIDGKWGVVWDRPNDAIVQHFTPRNSWGFQGGRVYARLPHGWRVRFINEDNGWTEDERIVYDDGYDANNATLFEGIEFPGVTDPDLNWRHGRFTIADARLRPEKFTLTTGWENVVCTRGDRVKVTHDVMLVGLASGRVKSVVGQVVTVDEVLTIENGKTYGFSFRVPEDVRSVVRAVDVTTAGEYTQLTLIGDLSLIAAGTLFGFGETDQESAAYRVYSVQHGRDLNATLTFVDDAPEISEADTGAIPPYTPNVTIPADPFTLPPQNLQYIESISGFGPNATVGVRLSWTMPRRGRVAAFEVQERDDNGGAVWTTVATLPWPTTSYDIPLIADGLWSYRVRCLFNDETVSDWATLATLNLQGLLEPPATVLNFRETFTAGRLWLTWDALADNRGILYEIRKGESWDAALVVGEAITQPKYQTVGDDTYWIAAYVITAFGLKIYSDQKQSLTLEGSVLTENVVVSKNEKATGWDGYFEGTIGVDSELGYIRTSGTADLLSSSDFLEEEDILNEGGQGAGIYISKRIVDAGRVMPCRVSVDYQATAVPAADDFLNNPDILNDPDFLKSYLTAFIRVYPIIRVGEANDPDVYASGDVFGEDDVFAAGITWGEWRKWSPDVYLGRFFQLGLQFEILDTSVGAIAYGLHFAWVIDVEDRLDRYQGLIVPPGGFPIEFKPTGSAVAVPFRGGINNEALPHITEGYVDKPAGYQIIVVDLTLAGCTVKVLNGAGVDVGGTGVNIFAQGYG